MEQIEETRSRVVTLMESDSVKFDGGSITSGFGTIDTGSSTITTTGVLTGGSVVVTNESSIGSASDTDAILVGAGGSVCFSNKTKH